MTNVTFTGWGACVPPSVLTNDDLARLQSLSEAQLGLIDSYRKDFESTDHRIQRAVDQVPGATTAQAAGLQEGDLIISIDGTPVDKIEDPLFVLAAGSEHLTYPDCRLTPCWPPR